MVADRFRRQHPDWSAGQLKAAVFERMYRDDFTTDEMKRIMASFPITTGKPSDVWHKYPENKAACSKPQQSAC